MPWYNDIDLNNWHNYEDVLTTSFWPFHRENSGVHNASYHGNFISQVPRQLFNRYTKKGGLDSQSIYGKRYGFD